MFKRDGELKRWLMKEQLWDQRLAGTDTNEPLVRLD